MRILLDTNAYSAFRRSHETVAELVRQSEEVLLSAVVAGELLFGFRNGTRYEENARALADFLEDPNVRLLPITWDTADFFGRISAGLRKKGRPIPTNDIWIAAHALELNADLISSDPHFGNIDGLSWRAFTVPGSST
ncbi:MAG TPA: type II toxin-antitoxin system VapC family toxin [Thermoanaerobaculia bacterium]|nr:type II toxin-antitoxin system VapC family toxin [Thermoanaerobaculia bacterium]